jgi:hypothetical protein
MRHDDFEISIDPGRLEVDMVHGFLSMTSG